MVPHTGQGLWPGGTDGRHRARAVRWWKI